MKCRVYLRIVESKFDLHEFGALISPWVGGRVRAFRFKEGPPIESPVSYWTSDEIEVSDGRPEEKLLGLLTAFDVGIRQLSLSPMPISAVVAIEHLSDEEIPGLYLSRELIGLLATLCGDLDVDYAYQL
ncbi:hypothetical protein [Lysobacter antibioticus]|uniref:hypothetical protein n=1 Tax=Lysobacter antibioticus TaxID=84531 RepID=UPI0007E8B690|nr:hypothetical protein [Lysobacter antibioticus]